MLISIYPVISIYSYQHIPISAYKYINISLYKHISISRYLHINTSTATQMIIIPSNSFLWLPFEMGGSERGQGDTEGRGYPN